MKEKLKKGVGRGLGFVLILGIMTTMGLLVAGLLPIVLPIAYLKERFQKKTLNKPHDLDSHILNSQNTAPRPQPQTQSRSWSPPRILNRQRRFKS